MLCKPAHHAGPLAPIPFNPFFGKTATRHGHKGAIVAVTHRIFRIGGRYGWSTRRYQNS
jgi:hypothetical protein